MATLYAKYGDATAYYGSDPAHDLILYGNNDTKFRYTVMLYDSSGVLLQYLDNFVNSVTWSWKILGGCDACVIALKKTFSDYFPVEAGYRVEIHINRRKRDTLYKVYTGYVIDCRRIYDDPEHVELRAVGYSQQMQRVIVGPRDNFYRDGVALEDTVRDILETYVTPQTDILLSDDSIAAIYDETGVDPYEPQIINFSQSAWDCIDYCAKLAGSYSWGVDKDRYFFFRPKATAVKGQNNFWYGKNVKQVDDLKSFEQIVNRIYVKDKYSSEVFERDSDRVLSNAAQSTETTDYIACGKATTYNKLKQTFTTAKKSISKIRLKLAPLVSEFSGSGFTNYIEDGTMESGNVNAWDDVGLGVSKSKYAVSGGTYCLQVKTSTPKTGVNQTISSPAAQQYVLRFNYRIITGDFKVVVNSISGATTTELATSERLTGKNASRTFISDYISFEVTGSPDSITVNFLSDVNWFSEFHLDDVTLFAQASSLNFYLADNEDPNLTPLPDTKIKKYITDLPRLGDDTTEFDIEFCYYGCGKEAATDYRASVGIATYALIMEIDGDTSDSAYFQFMYKTSSGYSGGELFYSDDDGDTWSGTSGDLWFKAYYNKSQELYGVHAEMAPSIPTTDIEVLRMWTAGYLSGKDREQKRIAYQIEGLRNVVEIDDWTGESFYQPGRVAFRPPAGFGLPQQLLYDDAKTIRIGDGYSAYQYFKCKYSMSVSAITIRSYKAGTLSSGNVWLEIQDLSGITVDNGTSELKACATYGSSAAAVSFSFADAPELLACKLYRIAVKSDATTDSSNKILAVYYDTADNYADGYLQSLAGSTITGHQDADLYFSVDGTELIDSLDIETLSYTTSENGIVAQVAAGQPLPDAARLFRRLEHFIQNQTISFGY